MNEINAPISEKKTPLQLRKYNNKFRFVIANILAYLPSSQGEKGIVHRSRSKFEGRDQVSVSR